MPDRPRLRQGLSLLWILLLTQLLGCGLFKPRDPRPGGGPGSNCLFANTPDNVVTNIIDHYAAVDGITCYTAMLDTSFVFHPDATDSIEALPDTVFANWNRDVETRSVQNIASDATFHLAVFDSQYAATITSPDQRTQTRFYAYHLVIHSSKPDTLYQGRADITFFQGGDAQWHITQWIDRRDSSGLRTWGYLRRVYRVGF